MNRYDRQLRLWGKEGQLLLTKSNVCIVGSESVLLQETIKNLVLVGITRFHWFDELSPQTRDTSSFFYDDLIEDMAPLSPNEVSIVKHSISDWNTIMQYETISLMIIICDGQDLEMVLKQDLEQIQFPVIMGYSSGLYGYLRIKLSEPHFIIESRPDYVIPSFYLDNPWSELSHYMDSIKFEMLDEYSFAQLPYIVLLYKVLQHLDASHDKITDKMIKDTLRDWYIKDLNPKGKYDLNYDEAMRYSYLAISNTDYRTKLNQLIQNCQDNSLKGHIWTDPYNDHVATLLQAIQIYLQNNDDINVLVDGNIPDMESSSKYFGTLQNVYQERADASFVKFQETVQQVCNLDHKVRPDNNLITSFYHNVKNIRCIKPSSCTTSEFLTVQPQRDYSPILKTLISLQTSSQSTMPHPHVNNKALMLTENYPTASLMAGLVADETIKLITHQYVPIDNTLTYDGIHNEMVTGTF